MPCLILDFDAAADAELLQERVRERAARGADASEADEAALAAQMRSAEPLGADEESAVVRCRPLPQAARAGGGEHQADWSALLQRLAAEAER